MTVALAKAFAPKVRVNCIAPGPFLTDVSTVWRENEAARGALVSAFRRAARNRRHCAISSDASSYDRPGHPRRQWKLVS
jgi:NAD(P)-dependent dehydrogenase (short-subunit alcohol dehydrogenase family)